MQALESLQIVRGTPDVEVEFNDIKEAALLASQVQNPWRLFFSKRHLPQVVLCFCSTTFQQFTGQPALPLMLCLESRLSSLKLGF